MPLTHLHDCIHIPEYGVGIPWLITASELTTYIPAGALTTSSGGWPQLRFTLFGITATFGLNFVSHPESKLLGVEFHNPADDTDATFRINSAALRRHLGDPNEIDNPEHHHLMWRDARVWVDYFAGAPDSPDAARRHGLSVHFHAGFPRAWVSDRDWALAQVKQLLNLMPEVEVVEVVGTPAYTTLGLAVRSFGSLARLAHATRAANVRFGVGVDEYRKANGEVSDFDPAIVQFRLEVPRSPDRGDPNTMRILGIYLTDDLRSQGILSAGEANRLRDALNPYDDHTDSAV
jgi:hypothetical protein